MRIAAMAFAALTGCASDGIAWGPVVYGSPPDDDGIETPAIPPRGGAGCAEVVLAARGDDRYAAWWEPAPGGASVLMLARSPDRGAHWETPIVADARDEGGLHCSRPAPSLYADPQSGYLHVTYHISPGGSPGVYFTHSMKASALGMRGEGVLHMPVAVTHGERPVRTSVAGRGDTVIVAFEDPNSAKPRVLVALSTGAGHAFAAHSTVSPPGAIAEAPRVSLDGDSVRVYWTERTAGTSRAAMRAGRLP